jgi:hypothetical protein
MKRLVNIYTTKINTDTPVYCPQSFAVQFQPSLCTHRRSVCTAPLYAPPLCVYRLSVCTVSLYAPPLCMNRLSVCTAPLYAPPLCMHRLSVCTASLYAPPLCMYRPSVYNASLYAPPPSISPFVLPSVAQHQTSTASHIFLTVGTTVPYKNCGTNLCFVKIAPMTSLQLQKFLPHIPHFSTYVNEIMHKNCT